MDSKSILNLIATQLPNKLYTDSEFATNFVNVLYIISLLPKSVKAEIMVAWIYLPCFVCGIVIAHSSSLHRIFSW